MSKHRIKNSFRNFVVLIGAFGILLFISSLIGLIFGILFYLKMIKEGSNPYWSELWNCTHGLLMLTGFILVIIFAYKKLRFAVALLIWLILAGSILFYHDISNQLYDGSASIKGSGRHYWYFSWPFYGNRMQNEFYRYVNKSGEYISELDETITGYYAGDFNDGLTVIGKDGKYGYMDKQGNVVIKPQYDDAGNFSDGFAIVLYDKKKHIIDKEGNIIKSDIPWAHCFSEGLAVFDINDLDGYIDTSGDIAIEPRFDRANYFHEGVAAVMVDDRYGYIDKQGQYVIKPIYSDAEDFSEGLAVVYDANDCRVIDKTGEVVLELDRSLNIYHFSSGLARVYKNHKYGYIDKSGKFAIQPSFRYANHFSEGLASVFNGRNWHYIDTTGNIAFESEYIFTGASDFSEGIARVRILKWALKRSYAYSSVILLAIITILIYKKVENNTNNKDK